MKRSLTTPSGRFHESELFQRLFEQTVQQCMQAGLIEGEHLSVDGSFIQANASNASRVPREQFEEAARVKGTVQQYLTELEQENGDEDEPPVHQQDRGSTTDPNATYASKGRSVATLGYYDNHLVDNHSCVIVEVQATAARLSQESVAARDMITRFTQRRGRPPQTLAANATYGNGELLHWLQERGITPHIRVKECPLPRNDLYGIEKFTYSADTHHYTCLEGKQLSYIGIQAGLAVELGQSPFLNVLSDRKVSKTLRMMGRAANDRITMGTGPGALPAHRQQGPAGRKYAQKVFDTADVVREAINEMVRRVESTPRWDDQAATYIWRIIA